MDRTNKRLHQARFASVGAPESQEPVVSVWAFVLLDGCLLGVVSYDYAESRGLLGFRDG